MSSSLRVGLTAWFLGLASFLVVAGSATLYFVAHDALVRGLDSRLMAQAQGVASLCEYEEGSIHLEGYYEIDGHLPLLEGDHGFEVRLQPSGEVQVHSGSVLPPPLPGHETGAVDQGDLRVAAITVTFPPREVREGSHPEPASPGFTVLVRAAAPLLPVEQELVRVRWAALLSAAISVGMSAVFAFFLSRRVILPLSRLGDAATRLSRGEEASLPRTTNGDEIDRLAVLLEHAFASVRASTAQQKRFVADASHELRNPVAAVASIAEIGLRRERTAMEYRGMLVEIEAVARRMSQALTSLLQLARLDETGRLSGARMDLAEVTQEVASSIESSARMDLQLAPSFLSGDRVLLAMLVRNLLENAIRHANSLVSIRIATERDQVVMRIVDDGPGVADSERERIFDRFFRGGDAKGTGAGLGLALVRSIARAHGGDCAPEQSGSGLALVVTFPKW